jgi:superfamily I DNA/RNA helicase
MSAVDHKLGREKDVKRIRDSVSRRKVVVAGPGTGKSFLFTELIRQKRAEGKTRFLAITFIGKLGDALADDLCGLATTNTMHGFARGFVLEHARGWKYYPKMKDLIAEDLRNEGIEAFEIGDENYVRRSKHYKAVGVDDVVPYAVRICRRDPEKIPIFDLILVDEYQDFNEAESEFVDLLARRNEIVIVGDDDQALYGFKGASPSFIRAKYDPRNTDWESFTLRFSSRCTEVMIRYFHSLVARLAFGSTGEHDPAKKRIEKEYICYLPDGDPPLSKIHDSRANPRIKLIKNCPVGGIAHKIWKELEKIVGSQKVNEVLIVGEGRSCRGLLETVARQLKNYGFRNVDLKGEGAIIPIRQDVVDAYRFLVEESSLLGWRILGNPKSEEDRKRHIRNAKTLNRIIRGTPSKVKRISDADALFLEDAIEDWGSREDERERDEAGDADTEEPTHRKKENAVRRSVLIQELKRGNLHLPRPLCDLEITVCNVLNSKGLGTDVVFLIGFDQGKFPAKDPPTDGEIYQMLVAVTRAKKRMYLINTIGSGVSGFVDCLDTSDLDVEDAQPRPPKPSRKTPDPRKELVGKGTVQAVG